MFINFFFIHFHQFSFIHVHQFSSHFHPVLSVFIHFHQFYHQLFHERASFLVKCSSILIYCPNLFFPGTASSRTKIPAEEEQRAQQLRRVLRSESEASEVGAVQLKNSPRECRLFFKNKSAYNHTIWLIYG